MQAKEDGEGGGLQRGELRAREGGVGYGAGNEGLEEGGAEEGAVAVRGGGGG